MTEIKRDNDMSILPDNAYYFLSVMLMNINDHATGSLLCKAMNLL